MTLSWNQLTALGVEGPQAAAMVSNKQLIAVILSEDPRGGLAADELAQRDLDDETIADLQTVEAELGRAGRDVTWVTRHLDSKREEAIRNRRAPRAKPMTEYLDRFLDDLAEDDFDSADDHVHMFTAGDWVALHAELAGRDPEDQPALLDAIGHGPPRGLFLLVEHLSGLHADVAAEAIAHMCETFAKDVALTPDELAIVMRHVPDLVEPFVISA
jgi:hypothetical protein